MIHGVRLDTEANEARLAAAAGVLMESLGVCAVEAFDWLAEESELSDTAILDLADLVFLDAARAQLPGTRSPPSA